MFDQDRRLIYMTICDHVEKQSITFVSGGRYSSLWEKLTTLLISQKAYLQPKLVKSNKIDCFIVLGILDSLVIITSEIGLA